MTAFIKSEEFVKLESEYPFLRRAREHFLGLKGFEYVIVDIETTGLEPETNEIIEIAALKIRKGEIIGVYNPLINIQQPLPNEIIRMTGITDEMLGEGQGKREALLRFLDFAGGTPLVAHNVEFDIPFLKYHIKVGLNRTFENPTICTLKLSRLLLPNLGAYKLMKVAEHFSVSTPLLHRAMADAEITYQVWLKLIELLERKEISTLEDLLKLIP